LRAIYIFNGYQGGGQPSPMVVVAFDINGMLDSSLSVEAGQQGSSCGIFAMHDHDTTFSGSVQTILSRDAYIIDYS
jgi:hypothetical protein